MVDVSARADWKNARARQTRAMGVRSGASGRSRGSEVYGERAVDDARDALRDRVRAFEAVRDRRSRARGDGWCA